MNKERSAMAKVNYEANKYRVYEIYGIPPSERHKYSMHHIWFKSDGPHWYYGDKFIDRKSNLYPLKKTAHSKLHLRVERMENK